MPQNVAATAAAAAAAAKPKTFIVLPVKARRNKGARESGKVRKKREVQREGERKQKIAGGSRIEAGRPQGHAN